MKIKFITTLAALGMALVISGCTNVRHIGQVNGLDLTRVTTRGVFSPSTTTVIVSDPNQPGTIQGPIANAQGPGFIPSVAQAAGTAGGAALLRPSRTNVETSAGASSTGGNASAIGGSGSTTQNGSVHHNTGNGNGSGNNGNH